VLAYVDDEDGADIVADYLKAGQRQKAALYASFVTLTEVRYVTIQEKDEPSADYLVGLVKSWPLNWIYPDERQCLLAARYKAQYRISLADAFVAAATSLLNASLVHKDPEFESMAKEIRVHALPFKTTKS
jgi:predicted nucleic acid-binding protein